MQQANSKKREKADSEEAWSGARTKAQPPRPRRSESDRTPWPLCSVTIGSEKKKLLDFYHGMTAVIGKWVETNLFFLIKLALIFRSSGGLTGFTAFVTV